MLLFVSAVSAQRLQIKARIADGQWTACYAIHLKRGDTFELRVDSVPEGVISWYQIIPDCREYYNNANPPGEKNAYAWVGFAKIAYFHEELTELKGRWAVTPAFRCTSFSSPYFHDTIGSFWVQAMVDVRGKRKSSYGIEDNDCRGLSPKVFRVSIRESDGYVGYITSFYNVPGLFGSTPYQANNYIGADCADVLMAAYAQWKGRILKKDYNVAMVVRDMGKSVSFTMTAGVPDTSIRWNSQVRPGDLIAVRYKGEKLYQHIGAFYRDDNADGIVDGDDLVLQAGPFPLCMTPLREGSFDGDVVVVSPK